jgi:starch phosphorylase
MEEVGTENIYIFGLKTEEVIGWKKHGYNPSSILKENEELQRVFTLLREGFFSPENKDLFRPIHDNLLYEDSYLLLADYDSYSNTQWKIGKDYLNEDAWTVKSIYNVARIGKFSSDRTIAEYAKDIWNVHQVKIKEPLQKFKFKVN